MMRVLPLALVTGASLFAATLSQASAQRPAAPVRPKAVVTKHAIEIVSQQVSSSRNGASIRLELSDGRTIDAAIRGGQAYLNGKSVGNAPRGGELERSFRSLLENVTDAQATAVPNLLAGWEPGPGEPARALDVALENAVAGIASSANMEGATAADAQATPAFNADGTPAVDSVEKLNERINELQNMVDNMDDMENATSVQFEGRRNYQRGPFHSFMSGLGNIFSVLIVYAIMFFVAVGVIAFGGRKYIEGAADTARKMTMRSWLVGLAATFLVVPAFILGIIALAISIVGIPVLLAWVPLYPLAVVGALGLGFLAVAHAAGESLSEKRFYENDYFQRGNSYYFLLTGMGLLLAAFIAAGVIEMAGPWLGWLRGLLIFLGVSTLWVAFTIGFGAVLVSRGGTRPLGKMPLVDDTFAEDLNV